MTAAARDQQTCKLVGRWIFCLEPIESNGAARTDKVRICCVMLSWNFKGDFLFLIVLPFHFKVSSPSPYPDPCFRESLLFIYQKKKKEEYLFGGNHLTEDNVKQLVAYDRHFFQKAGHDLEHGWLHFMGLLGSTWAIGRVGPWRPSITSEQEENPPCNIYIYIYKFIHP